MTDTASIETALESAILASRRAPAPRDHFYMSSLGFCVRKQIAERAGLPPTNPPDARSLFKMMGGTVIGKAIQQLLLANGFLEPDSVEQSVVYRSYHGKLDGRTKRLPEESIVEIKTADDSAITRYDGMPDHYKWQSFGYCLATGLTSVLLFQVGKNQGLTKNRVYHLDDEWIHVIDDSITEVEYAWKVYEGSKELPPHSHRFTWENKLCSFAEPKEKGMV